MSLVAFLVRRTLVALGLVFALVVVTWLVWVQVPGDPASILTGVGGDVTEEEIAEAREALGVDEPVHVQFAKYVARLAQGDFGISWFTVVPAEDNSYTGAPVRDAVFDAARVTGSLVLGGVLVLGLIALPLGLLAASREGSMLDRLTIAISLVAISTHPIVVGLLLRLVTAEQLQLVPPRGYCSFSGDSPPPPIPGTVADPVCGGPADWASHLVLPWITFALFLVAIYMRMVRARTIDVLGEPFITVARAKGASEWRVLTRHGGRVIVAPILTMLAMDVGMALGLAIYVEAVFGLPGLGTLSLRALNGDIGYDRPMILGIVVVSGLAIVTLNLLADLAAAAVDPRVREGSRSRRSVAARSTV